MRIFIIGCLGWFLTCHFKHAIIPMRTHVQRDMYRLYRLIIMLNFTVKMRRVLVLSQGSQSEPVLQNIFIENALL